MELGLVEMALEAVEQALVALVDVALEEPLLVGDVDVVVSMASFVDTSRLASHQLAQLPLVASLAIRPCSPRSPGTCSVPLSRTPGSLACSCSC